MDLIYCAGGNERLSQIAHEEGWQLGKRSDKSLNFAQPMFIDIEYKRPNFEKHLEVVVKYRPKYATVPDLSESQVSKSDVERAIRQAEQMSRYCQYPLIVPKLAGQLALLPPDIAIGYSVPSSYGGVQFAIWEVIEHLQGRRIHLLGGSPRKQIEAYLHLSSIAHVGSADGNYAQGQAIKYAMYWEQNRWHYHPQKDDGVKDLYFECWRWSCRNLYKAWQILLNQRGA